MAIISGLTGAVNGAIATRDWKIRHSNLVAPHIICANQGGVGRIPGAEDWTGVFHSYTGISGIPTALPGTLFTFTGDISGTATGGFQVEGAAIVDKLEIVVDIEGGKLVETTTFFSGDGTDSLTYTAGTGATPTAGLPIHSASSAGVYGHFNGAGVGNYTPALITDCRYLKVTITSNNRRYMTGGNAGRIQRTPGAIDAQFVYRVYATVGSPHDDMPSPGDIGQVQLFYTATNAWDLEEVIIEAINDLGIDKESGQGVGYEVMGSFRAYDGGTTGFIKYGNTASATEFWPG